MKSGKALFNVIFILIGVAIGFVLFLIIGTVQVYREGGKPLKGSRTFGDIKLFVYQKPGGEDIIEGCPQMLMISRNNIPILALYQNRDKRMEQLAVLNPKEILTLKTLYGQDGLGPAIYCKLDQHDKVVGDVWMDMNFDGIFDMRRVVDKDGNTLSQEIFINGKWEKVTTYDLYKSSASAEGIEYVFNAEGKWVRK